MKHYPFDKRFAVTKELKVGYFVSKIDGNGPVFAGPFGCLPHVLPSVIRSRKLRRHHGGNASKSQAYCEGLRGLPLKVMECGAVNQALSHNWEGKEAKVLCITAVFPGKVDPTARTYCLWRWGFGEVKGACPESDTSSENEKVWS